MYSLRGLKCIFPIFSRTEYLSNFDVGFYCSSRKQKEGQVSEQAEEQEKKKKKEEETGTKVPHFWISSSVTFFLVLFTMENSLKRAYAWNL